MNTIGINDNLDRLRIRKLLLIGLIASVMTGIGDFLIFAWWYAVVPDKPPIEEIQQDICDCMVGSFSVWGKIFNLNRKPDNRLAGKIFKKTADTRAEEIRRLSALLLSA